MFTFIIVVLILVSIILGLVILVQNSKGGGLAAGLSASNQIMGVRKTTDFLEKLTWGFAIGLLVLSMMANFVLPDGTADTGASMIQEQIDNTAAPAPQQQQLPMAAPDTNK